MAASWRKRVVVGGGVVLGVAVLAVAGLVAYLTLSDLGRHRARVEALLSEAVGFDLRIRELHVDLDLNGPSRLEARGITLANPSWVGDPGLATVDHLVAEVELWPLLEQRVVVRDLELTGARGVVVVDEDGRCNWAPPPKEPRDDVDAEPWVSQIVVDRAVVAEGLATVSTPARAGPLEVAAQRLELSTDPDDTLDIRLDGEVAGRPVRLEGRLGRVAELVTAGAVTGDLWLEVGSARLSVRGRVADLATLAGPELALAVEGPRIEDVAGLLGAPSTVAGPFRVAVELAPAGDGLRLVAEAGLGDLNATVDGDLDSLRRPRSFDVTVAAGGPDLAAVGALLGAEGLPAEGFRVAGRVAWQGFPLTVEDLVIRVGANRVVADGVLGAPPSLPGTDLRFEGEGPDVSALASLAGVDLPRLPYRLSGSLERAGDDATTVEVEARVGATRLELSGRLGDPPHLADSRLEITVAGSSLAPFRDLADLELPDEAFEVVALLVPEEGALRVDRAVVRVGPTSVEVAGRVSTSPGIAGTTLHLRLAGEDLSRLQWAHGVEGLPAVPLRAEGDLAVERRGLRLADVTVTVGELEATVAGTLGLGPGGSETDLEVEASGPDASWPLEVAGLDGGHGVPYQVSGRLRLAESRLELVATTVRLGDLELEVAGRVPLGETLDGAQLLLVGRGSCLTDLEAFGAPAGLPAVPFAVSGTVRVEGDGLRLTGATATVADRHRLDVDGLVIPSGGLDGTDLVLRLQGPDLGEAGRLASGVVDLPELPGEPYAVTADVAVGADGVAIRSLRGELGPARAVIAGRLGRRPGLRGTDLTLDVGGPNASLFTALTGVSVPVAPFEVHGRVGWDEAGARFDGLSVRLGDNRAWLDGRLGEPPWFVGSNLVVRAEGPTLSVFTELAGGEPLPALPFQLSGHVQGSPTRFRVDDLEVRLGGTDLGGDVRIALGERPEVEARVSSAVLDLAELQRDRTEARAEAATVVEVPSSSPRVLSDEPLDLGWLERFDADLVWHVDLLRLPATTATELDLTLRLDRGRLEIGPIDATGERGGRLGGRLLLEPVDGSYRVEAELHLDDGVADLTAGSARSTDRMTTVNAVLDLRTRGRTPHELAASANGRWILSLSGGQLDDSILDFIGAPLILTVMKTLNPFHGGGSRAVDLECAVLVAEATGGLFVLEPMAVKSTNVTIVGHGAVDFNDEQLDFEWVVKPRRGVGISASTITNPYVKLGGTLTAPSLQAKPVEAIASTGVAVATGGLSLLGKGLWDRVTAERKVCQKALNEAKRRLAAD